MSQTYRLDWIREREKPAGPTAPTATHYRWLAHGILLMTVYGCLIPLRYRPLPFDEALTAFRSISYSDPSQPEPRGDWVVSIAQFAVLSYFYMAASCVDRRRAADLVAALIVIPGGVAVSVALEFLQIYFPPRTVSQNDIVVESIGALAGVLLWLLAGRRITGWLRRFWGAKGMSGLASQALPAYFVTLLVVHAMPFDLTISGDELALKYQQGKIRLLPLLDRGSGGLGPLLDALSNAACFFPLGVLMALAPGWAGRSRSAMLLLGLGVTCLVEVLQFFIYSRHSDAIDIATGTAAVLAGWWAVRALRNSRMPGRVGGLLARLGVADCGRSGLRTAAIGMVLLLGWFAVLAFVNWRPFDFTTDRARFVADGLLTDENTPVYGLRRMTWAPLADYYWGSKYQAADQFVQKSLSFAPLGLLWALGLPRGGRPGAGFVVVLVALLLGFVIEFGQYFIPDRHPSVTDLLIECLGGWSGFALARHVRAAIRVETALHGKMREFCR